MALSDCPECWETPCCCGHGYQGWAVERLASHIKMLSMVLVNKVDPHVPEPPPRDPYEGPIETGMRFVWEPDKPQIRCVLEVTEFIDEGDPYDSLVRTMILVPDTYPQSKPGAISANSERRFREACIPYAED